MNRSWTNNSNASPGFVYYNVNKSYQMENRAETSDYLSFNESPKYGTPKCNKFSPAHYSSPNRFHKSPKSFNNRNNFRYSALHNSHNSQSYSSSNNSFNSSFSNSRRSENGPQHRKKFHSSFGDRDDKGMSKYFDDTSVKDPWAELEVDLKKKRESKTAEDLKNAKRDETMANKEENSSESEEEEDSEPESKSSTSGIDENTT